MTELLKGKVAIVTGGTRGIGKAIASQFAEEGAQVIVTYRSSVSLADEMENSFKAKGLSLKCISSDAANFASAEELISMVVAEYGRVDVLVNNAGVVADNLLLRMSEEQWDKVIQTNLGSCFNLCKNVLRPMLKQRGGSIINISSIIGLEGNAGQANYAASKAGIIGFSKSIAKEVASRSIRCNVVAPGFIETDMTQAMPEKTQESYKDKIPMKRFGTVEEIANVCTFLASDKSSYISGQTISVCGALHS